MYITLGELFGGFDDAEIIELEDMEEKKDSEKEESIEQTCPI